MELKINYSEFENRILSFKEEFNNLSKLNISDEKQLDELEQSFDLIKKNCIIFIETNISDDVNQEFSQLIGNNNGYLNLGKLTFHQLLKLFTDQIRNITSNLDYLLQIIKISDPLYTGKSFLEERSEFTVSEKLDFLLSKLYSLRKTDKYWDTCMIFEMNQVQSDNYDEPREITKTLENYGYVKTVGSFQGMSAKITSEGKLYYEQNLKSVTQNKKNKNISSMDIFISHSSQDIEAAKLLIDLIKTALNLSSDKIRCTSVNGYRLPAGVTTNDKLRQEVHDSKVLIGLISHNSINSAYVLFELGARWGASLPLIPLVNSQLGSELLKGPLSGINALNSCESAQLQQLITELKLELGIEGEPPAVYQEKLDLLVEHSLKELLPTSFNNSNLEKIVNTKDDSLVVDYDLKIKNYCEKEWPNDYTMRLHSRNEQINAYRELMKI